MGIDVAVIKYLTALIILVFAVPSQATGCYTPREFEAEQGIRIDSELMVIGLTCVKTPVGRQAYQKYRSFLHKNQQLVAAYENDILNYYRRQGHADPEASLHTLRTNIANDVSKQAIKMSTSDFCRRFGGRVDQALSMDQEKLRQWAQTTWPGNHSRPVACIKS